MSAAVLQAHATIMSEGSNINEYYINTAASVSSGAATRQWHRRAHMEGIYYVQFSAVLHVLDNCVKLQEPGGGESACVGMHPNFRDPLLSCICSTQPCSPQSSEFYSFPPNKQNHISLFLLTFAERSSGLA